MDYKENDKAYLWHPLTQHKTAVEPLLIEKSEGVYLWDGQGNRYIDAISSWYTGVFGHRNPENVKAVQDALSELDQVVFTGFTHRFAIEMADALVKLLPGDLKKVFFSDNGSTSVDVAMKMAIQYWYNKGEKRTKFVAFHEAFHGDTFGAMSASDLDVYNGPFKDFHVQIERISAPNQANFSYVKEKLNSFLEQDDVIAFIYEPLVQGAAGMKIHDADLLDQLLEMVKDKGVLCIADEVMTGLGKTGSNFASDQLQNTPDIICLSKALTGGMLPMGLTVASQKVFDAFYDQDIIKGFFHGHTYSANPLACAVAKSCIDLIKSKYIQDQILWISEEHNKFVQKLNDFDSVKNPRSIGAIMAFELDEKLERYGEKRNAIYSFFMERGVYLRPLGNTIYIVPPYVISKTDLDYIYSSILEFLSIN